MVFRLPPTYFFVDENDVVIDEALEKLKRRGVLPTKGLRKLLTDPDFLRLAEDAANLIGASEEHMGQLREIASDLNADSSPRKTPRRRRPKA